VKYSHSGGNTCSVEVDIWKNIIESQTLSYLPNTAGLQINTEETIESPQENTNTFRKANYHTQGHEGCNREQSIGLSVARLFEPPGGELTRPGSRTDVRALIKPPVRPGTVASPIIQKKKHLAQWISVTISHPVSGPSSFLDQRKRLDSITVANPSPLVAVTTM